MSAALTPAAAQARRDARAHARRDRILDAAQRCFAERGFHGASIALIAEAAQMSQGLIYRYFDGKSALIRGIVDRQMGMLSEDLRDMRLYGETPAEQILHLLTRGPRSSAGAEEACNARIGSSLMMEITAEASRQPEIAEILHAFDQRIDASIAQWLATAREKGGFGVTPSQVQNRVILLRALVDGLSMRLASTPDFDPARLRAVVDDATAYLVADCPRGPP